MKAAPAIIGADGPRSGLRANRAKRTPLYVDGYALLPLTRGAVAKVDAHIADHLSQWAWQLLKTKSGQYAVRQERHGDGGRKKVVILLHRYLMSAPASHFVDHIDGDGLNNTMSNLRLADFSQNIFNARLRKDSQSGEKGVRYLPKRSAWQARIKARGLEKAMYFKRKDDAVAWRSKMALEMHGDFAR